MFNTASGVSLSSAACNDQTLTFTLNASNNFTSSMQLLKPYKAICVAIISSQIAKIKIQGVSLNNYVYDSTATPFPFVKSDEIMTATDKRNCYFIENTGSYISYIKLTASDPSQLISSNLTLTIIFYDYIPSLIAE